MEAKEKEKGDNEKNKIVVESKNFSCIRCKEGVILRESHKWWEKEISLWNKHFGSSIGF